MCRDLYGLHDGDDPMTSYILYLVGELSERQARRPFGEFTCRWLSLNGRCVVHSQCADAVYISVAAVPAMARELNAHEWPACLLFVACNG